MRLEFDENDLIVAAALRDALTAIVEAKGATVPSEGSNAPTGVTDDPVERLNEIAEEICKEDPARPNSIEIEIDEEQPATGVDSKGHTWDERIHATTKTTVKDGTWKLRRGADPVLVASIYAEQDGETVAPAPAPAPAPVPPAPVPPAPEPTTASDSVTTFTELMNYVLSVVGTGRITQGASDAILEEACKANDVSNTLMLATVPDAVQGVYEYYSIRVAAL
jgi:hypothetical protein